MRKALAGGQAEGRLVGGAPGSVLSLLLMEFWQENTSVCEHAVSTSDPEPLGFVLGHPAKER